MQGQNDNWDNPNHEWLLSWANFLGILSRDDAGEEKQVQGFKHLIGNGHRTRQKHRQTTTNAAAGNRDGEMTNIGEVINRWLDESRWGQYRWCAWRGKAGVRKWWWQECLMQGSLAPLSTRVEEREQAWHILHRHPLPASLIRTCSLPASGIMHFHLSLYQYRLSIFLN